MDHYTKLTNTVPMKVTAAAESATHFVNGWIFNYGPAEEHITDNGGC